VPVRAREGLPEIFDRQFDDPQEQHGIAIVADAVEADQFARLQVAGQRGRLCGNTLNSDRPTITPARQHSGSGVIDAPSTR
jgi:hypothetical protein